MRGLPEELRWIHRLAAAVLVDALERLRDLDSSDQRRFLDARAAAAWIESNDDHPLSYLGTCEVLHIQPKFGRRITRKLERSARHRNSPPSFRRWKIGGK